VLCSLSLDSIVHDEPADKPGDAKRGGPAETSEPAGQELLDAAHIALDRTQMQIEDKLVSFTEIAETVPSSISEPRPGMPQ
jgi:hemolysin D